MIQITKVQPHHPYDQKQRRLRTLRNQAPKLDKRLARLRVIYNRYTNFRLALFIAGGVVAAALFLSLGPTAAIVAAVIFAALFVAVVYYHNQVEQAIARYEIWLAIKRAHIARIERDWANLPETLPVPPPLDHSFATDLDLIGPRSLHHLLDTTTSREASERLRQWLLDNNPDLDVIGRRQALVAELAGMVRFRDRLALYATLATNASGEKWSAQPLLKWLDPAGDSQSMRLVLWVLAILAATNFLLLILDLVAAWPALWPFSWLLYVIIYFSQSGRVTSLFRDALFLESSLTRPAAVFDLLENYAYAGKPNLRALCSPFLDGGKRPSQQLKQVTILLSAASFQQNPLAHLILNAAVPWDLFFVYRLEQRKRELAGLLPQWMDAWFEVEALSALANFAYLNPDTTFPEVVTEPAVPIFAAQELGHPLIPNGQRVDNDFTIDELGSVVLITGSNMTGKSSFLRTVGVNLRLAYTGGTVQAQTLRLAPFRLFTSIHVSDSLAQGTSYFYAEVKKLTALLKELNREDDYPLFFLIDEIFRGTNNRERLAGSRAYVEALMGRRGAGMIATHDLELAQLAGGRTAVTNYHFRDDVHDGRMVFDYKLRPGPSTTTNALKIMQQFGLPVNAPDTPHPPDSRRR